MQYHSGILVWQHKGRTEQKQLDKFNVECHLTSLQVLCSLACLSVYTGSLVGVDLLSEALSAKIPLS